MVFAQRSNCRTTLYLLYFVQGGFLCVLLRHSALEMVQKLCSFSPAWERQEELSQDMWEEGHCYFVLGKNYILFSTCETFVTLGLKLLIVKRYLKQCFRVHLRLLEAGLGEH